MIRLLTAGESHGPGLTVILDGLPAGLEVSLDAVNDDLRRRQGGYGRGGRMAIEKDEARVTGGLRFGRTMGGPLCLLLENRDWPSWAEAMRVAAGPEPDEAARRRVRAPRPGHADLAGALKHDTYDARDVLERASARETAARVAAGGVLRQFLKHFGIEVASHTLAVGDVAMPGGTELPWEAIVSIPPDSPMRCADASVEPRMIAAVDRARAAQDSVGGAFQVVARGVPPGLGSCRQWDTRLEARLGQALLSIQGVKGVEIGEAVAGAALPGSKVHDEIDYDAVTRRFRRATNRAGGIEGGMSNGEEVRATAWLKPLSTLPRPLRTVDLETKRPALAAVERTDTCVVPAAGVIGEAMTSLVLAEAFLEKFGGDAMEETARNHRAYLARLEAY